MVQPVKAPHSSQSSPRWSFCLLWVPAIGWRESLVVEEVFAAVFAGVLTGLLLLWLLPILRRYTMNFWSDQCEKSKKKKSGTWGPWSQQTRPGRASLLDHPPAHPARAQSTPPNLLLDQPVSWTGSVRRAGALLRKRLRPIARWILVGAALLGVLAYTLVVVPLQDKAARHQQEMRIKLRVLAPSGINIVDRREAGGLGTASVEFRVRSKESLADILESYDQSLRQDGWQGGESRTVLFSGYPGQKVCYSKGEYRFVLEYPAPEVGYRWTYGITLGWRVGDCTKGW